MSATVWIGVALAGGVGASLRFLVDAAISQLLARWRRFTLPIGTMVVNISGAAALGVLAGLTLPAEGATIIGTGLVGSYTTFSTWMAQTYELAEARHKVAAATTLVLSLALGLLAVAGGRWLAGG